MEAAIQSESLILSRKASTLSTNSMTTVLFSPSISTSFDSSSFDKTPVVTMDSMAFRVDSIAVSKNPSGFAVLILGKTEKKEKKDRGFL